MSLPLPRIAGILNLTADSFSDGGKYTDTAAAVRHGMAMLENGADLLDIGAESTRPGAAEIPAETEIDALLPVITELKRKLPDCVISIDTRKAVVADAVLKCGADIINDVSGLQFDPAMADAVAQYPAAGLVLMHSRGTPETMQQEQNLIYAFVNTLTELSSVSSVRFQVEGETVDHLVTMLEFSSIVMPGGRITLTRSRFTSSSVVS